MLVQETPEKVISYMLETAGRLVPPIVMPLFWVSRAYDLIKAVVDSYLYSQFLASQIASRPSTVTVT